MAGGQYGGAIITTRCVPSAWRQGVVVHLPKGGDTGDCCNYRPLTLLPVIDKLFAKLLSERIARAVRLHDQQYAFRPGRGTLNPLQNLVAVMRQWTQANKATYACLFDAAKAYDSVLHTLLLHRLLQCCVVGPVFAILVAMYSSASSRVRVVTALHVSPAFAVQRGLVQGRPLVEVEILNHCIMTPKTGRFNTTVPVAVCDLHRPCIAGHAELVAPRHAVGWTGHLRKKVSGPGLCG